VQRSAACWEAALWRGTRGGRGRYPARSVLPPSGLGSSLTIFPLVTGDMAALGEEGTRAWKSPGAVRRRFPLPLTPRSSPEGRGEPWRGAGGGRGDPSPDHLSRGGCVPAAQGTGAPARAWLVTVS